MTTQQQRSRSLTKTISTGGRQLLDALSRMPFIDSAELAGIYEYLEERRVFYAIRLPSNKVLQYEIAPLLIRPVGRPPKRPVILYDDFWYRAGSWDRARRVVAKVEWHRGELFPRVGFIVTNMTAGPEGVVRFYNGRGTAEQWIKEGKYALNWTRLSCHRFVANRVRLSLFILAYNLGNFLRRLCLPKAVRHWSLRSVQVKLIKMGGRLVRHSRRLIFQLSEVSVPRRLFQGVLDRIDRGAGPHVDAVEGPAAGVQVGGREGEEPGDAAGVQAAPLGHGVQGQRQRGQQALALPEGQGVQLAQGGGEVGLRPLGHLLERRLVLRVKGDRQGGVKEPLSAPLHLVAQPTMSRS